VVETLLSEARPQAARGDRGRILVVDDQAEVRTSTVKLLRAEGYDVFEAGDGPAALALLAREPIEVMLTDLRLTPTGGLELLRRTLDIAPQTQVVVMTAFGSLETAVEAMRLGAYDYITKPFKEGELAHRMGRALERARLISAVNLFAGEFNQRHGFSSLVGRSAAMRQLIERIVRVAPTDATVLIQGESGTGKELVARALHAHSLRKERPFVPVNCAAITEGLLESELFGHAKGSFTGAVRARRGLFEEADGGTLFIDEVSETGPAFQSKLLRVLEDGEVRRVGESTSIRVDVRTVAATNRKLAELIPTGGFRQDLYYRLNVVALEVPPLRERLEDVPLLAEHFLQRANARSARQRRLTQSALDHLAQYPFPGNVRELENLVEQAAALSSRDELFPEDFPLKFASAPTGSEERHALAEIVEEAERQAIQSSLRRHLGDLTRVAADLRVSPTTLWRKMKRLRLPSQ
jgi:two-component system response regulator HydG